MIAREVTGYAYACPECGMAVVSTVGPGDRAPCSRCQARRVDVLTNRPCCTRAFPPALLVAVSALERIAADIPAGKPASQVAREALAEIREFQV